MDKEIKSINQVQDAESEATKIVEKALAKKQRQIEDATSKARTIVEEAEKRAKEEIAASVILVQKELEKGRAQEAKETQKAVEEIKKRKLSQTKISEISQSIANEIAGE